jgi:hypothetical protein
VAKKLLQMSKFGSALTVKSIKPQLFVMNAMRNQTMMVIGFRCTWQREVGATVEMLNHGNKISFVLITRVKLILKSLLIK